MSAKSCFFLLLLFSFLLEEMIGGVCFVLLFFLAWYLQRGEREIVTTAFFFGFLLDLFSNSFFGINSLFLLSFLFLLDFLRRKINGFFAFLLASFLAGSLYQSFFALPVGGGFFFSPKDGFFHLLLGFLLFQLIRFLEERIIISSSLQLRFKL